MNNAADQASSPTPTRDRAQRLRLLALDVDGVLTDGRIYYGNNGEELKAFNIKDGVGIKALQRGGIRVALITGRSSAIVERRARELGIEPVVQGREDKLVALRELCATLGLDLAECAYMGDDLPDLAAIEAAGLGLTVADGCEAVRRAAAWCSSLPGGAGAVREASDMLLEARGDLAALEAAWSSGSARLDDDAPKNSPTEPRNGADERPAAPGVS